MRLLYEVCIVYLKPFKCVCHSGHLNTALLKAMSVISKKKKKTLVMCLGLLFKVIFSVYIEKVFLPQYFLCSAVQMKLPSV